MKKTATKMAAAVPQPPTAPAVAPQKSVTNAKDPQTKQGRIVKSLRARIRPDLTETQLRYLAVHLDIAGRMQDKWLETKIGEEREFFREDYWEGGTGNPHAAVLSRDPGEVKRAQARIEYNAEYALRIREDLAEQARKDAERKDAERKRTKHRFGL
jgi:hypothetical protein